MKTTARTLRQDDSRHNKRPLWLNVFGLLLLGLFGYGAYLALVASPPDVQQGDLIRVMYPHVAVAWICFVAVGMTALFGTLYLWRGRRIHDVIAVASAELGIFFGSLTLLGGMTYSKPTLNTFWTWDARFTTTALLFFLLVGYFIVRGLVEDPDRRARVSAVVSIIAFADVPIIYFATEWWRTLHPPLSIQFDGGGVTMDSRMLFVLLYNVGVAALIYVYLMIERVRIGRLEARLEETLEKAAEKDTVTRGEVVHV